MHCPCNCIKVSIGFLSYLFMTPTYINMLTIYAYCNTHDISWGTKGLTGGATTASKLGDRFKKFRYNMLVLWILFNMIGSYLFTQLVRRGAAEQVLTAFSIFLAISLVFRLVASIISTCCCSIRCKKKR